MSAQQLAVFVTGRLPKDMEPSDVRGIIQTVADMGFKTHDWVTPQRKPTPIVTQDYETIHFLQNSTVLMVVLPPTRDPEFAFIDSATAMHIGIALSKSLTVIVIDPKTGTHADGLRGLHPVLSNVHGFAAMERGHLVIVPTVAAALTRLRCFTWTLQQTAAPNAPPPPKPSLPVQAPPPSADEGVSEQKEEGPDISV